MYAKETDMKDGAEEIRAPRIPIGGPRDILSVSGLDPAFEYRWVNDDGDKIQRFKDAWWEPVTHEVKIGMRTAARTGKSGKDKITTINVGHGMTAILMRLPKEIYDEAQKEKQEIIKNKEASMKRKLNSGEDGAYGGVEFS